MTLDRDSNDMALVWRLQCLDGMKKLVVSSLLVALVGSMLATTPNAEASATGVRIQLFDATGRSVFVGPLTYAAVKGDASGTKVTFTSANASVTYTCNIAMTNHAAALELYKIVDTTPNLNVGCQGTPTVTKTATASITQIDTDKFQISW